MDRQGHRFSAVVAGLTWLRAHRGLVLVLTAVTIGLSFALDLLIPGYAIAGCYLVPVMLVAFAVHERLVVAAVSAVCLALAVTAMVVQHRVGAQNVLLIWFGCLAGAGLIALGYLYNRFDRLYEMERSTTARLQALTARLRRLQEFAVLGSDRPLSELLQEVVTQARALLGGAAGALYRVDSAGGAVVRECGDEDAACGDAQLLSALRGRRPVAVATAGGPGLAVPLAARDDAFGVLTLSYAGPHAFKDEDLHVASAFADQAALAIENARLREQIEHAAVAAERTRLARDLHDSVTQSLFAASLKAEALRRAWQPDEGQAREALLDVERLTRGALAEMRTLLLEMRPATLTQVPMGDLLQHLVASCQARTRTLIELRAAVVPQPPAEVVVALHRIAQEALNNVVRHAEAPHARVSLMQRALATVMEVRDDGRGFDPLVVQAHQLGLRIMRERAEAAGVALRIRSARGAGTTVTATYRQEG